MDDTALEDNCPLLEATGGSRPGTAGGKGTSDIVLVTGSGRAGDSTLGEGDSIGGSMYGLGSIEDDAEGIGIELPERDCGLGQSEAIVARQKVSTLIKYILQFQSCWKKLTANSP